MRLIYSQSTLVVLHSSPDNGGKRTSAEKKTFIADPGFDAKRLRKLLSRIGLRALIKENPRNAKLPRRGRKKYFDETLYKTRYVNERAFAWIDSFRTLLIRFDTTTESWLNCHYLAAFMLIGKV